MHTDDVISEFFGALANMLAKNGSKPLGKDELLAILRITQIETSQGAEYVSAQGPKWFVEKAKEYWNGKDCSSVVGHIDAYLKP